MNQKQKKSPLRENTLKLYLFDIKHEKSIRKVKNSLGQLADAKNFSLIQLCMAQFKRKK